MTFPKKSIPHLSDAFGHKRSDLRKSRNQIGELKQWNNKTQHKIKQNIFHFSTFDKKKKKKIKTTQKYQNSFRLTRFLVAGSPRSSSSSGFRDLGLAKVQEAFHKIRLRELDRNYLQRTRPRSVFFSFFYRCFFCSHKKNTIIKKKKKKKKKNIKSFLSLQCLPRNLISSFTPLFIKIALFSCHYKSFLLSSLLFSSGDFRKSSLTFMLYIVKDDRTKRKMITTGEGIFIHGYTLHIHKTLYFRIHIIPWMLECMK